MIKTLHPHTVEAYLLIAGVAKNNIKALVEQAKSDGAVSVEIFKQQETSMFHAVGQSIVRVTFTTGEFVDIEVDC